MSAKYDIEITQGTDLIIPFLLEDTSGNKQDLTSYSVKVQIKVSTYSSSFLDDLSTENGRIKLKEDSLSDQVNSSGIKPKCIIECSWPNEITSKFPVGRHVYELKLISASNFISKILEGNFIVNWGIIK